MNSLSTVDKVPHVQRDNMILEAYYSIITLGNGKWLGSVSEAWM